jgi:hypothetical protein
MPARPQFVEQRAGGAVRFEKPEQHQQEIPEYNPAPMQSQPQPQYTAPAVDISSVLREQSVAPAPYAAQAQPQPVLAQPVQDNRMFQHQPAMRPNPQTSYRREVSEPLRGAANSARGFFKRMADAGRALSARSENEKEKEMEEPRVQVVQKPSQPMPSSDRPAKDQDQYLDIPAFLRRQAN